jgi:hypothetical protein
MKTGILIHGCNLNIENWRHVAWGDPPDQLGRIPHGVLMAKQMDAAVIVFGTGASAKEFELGVNPSPGKKLVEAVYSLEYLTQHFDSLRKFPAFQEGFATGDGSNEPDGDSEWRAFRESTLSKIVLDTNSENTTGEIVEAANIFIEHKVERVVLVSSPSHIVRCLRDATSILSSNPKYAHLVRCLFASPSATCYEGSSPGDVVVVEPPHRPDRHVVSTHRRIQRMLTLQRLEHDQLVQLIEEFDDLLQRYEHRYFNS